MNLDRRRLLRLMLLSAFAGPLGSCGGGERPHGRPARPGDPLETLQVRGYRGLAELPYFELDPHGRLRVTVDDLSPGIDCHTHLAFNMLLSPRPDLLRRTARTDYLIDCDGERPPCVLDLDVYMNRIANGEMLDHMEAEIRGMLLFGSNAAETFTIPNLLDEMDAVGFRQAVLLPIATGLFLHDDLTRWWLHAVKRSGAADRFIMFGSVHPTATDAPRKLRALARLGIRGVKLHPTMQRFAPDDHRAMRIYQVCDELHLPVFFHAGRAGIEPKFTRHYARMKNYVAPVREFPSVRFIFGHSGARDFAEALPIAQANANVSMDIQGQGVSAIREMMKTLGPERLLFGSDWPWYPLAATLAKVFLATRGDARVRNLIVGDNARRFFAETPGARTRKT